jgi:uncharacterized protein YqeY
MATLLERLQDDLKNAIKSRDEMRTGVLRMLRARIQEKQVEPGVDKPLGDDAVQQILATYAKQRRDAAEAFEAAGRPELRDRELQERDIVMAYLPEQLDDDAVREVLRALVASSGASSMRDMGKVMGPAMQQLRGRVEGSRVQQLLREILGSGA